jgi:hypothetical protein
VNRKDQRQLDTVRRGQAEAAEQIAKSREVVEDSWALLRRTEATQKPAIPRRHAEDPGQDHAAHKKTRPSVPAPSGAAECCSTDRVTFSGSGVR